MRKNLLFGLPVALFMGMLFTSVGLAAEKYDVTATEVFDPFGYMGDPVGGFIEPGTVKCPGHVPVMDPMLPPCPIGSRTHIRDAVIATRVFSDDPRVAGLMFVEMNANWDANFEGPIWGTFSLMLDSEGIWVGTWQAVRVFDGVQYSAELHVIGKGFGGLVDGMQLIAEDRIAGIYPMPIAYEGAIEGRILDPKAGM